MNYLQFPKLIEGYSFEKVFKKYGTNQDYGYAIYKNDKGKRAFAKLWIGKRKDGRFNRLAREYEMTKLLNGIEYRTRAIVPTAVSTVSIPQVIAQYQKEGLMLVLYEYIRATPIANVTSAKKIIAIEKAVSYLQFLYAHMNQEEKILVGKRAWSMFGFLYVGILIKAFMVQSQYGVMLLKSAIPFFRSFFELFEVPTGLAHRDLHGKNIAIWGDKVWILDFSYLTITIQAYDYLAALGFFGHDKRVVKHILGQAVQEYGVSRVVGFTSFFATLMFTGKNFSRIQEENYRNLLSLSPLVKGGNEIPKREGFFKKILHVAPTIFRSAKSHVALPHQIRQFSLVENLSPNKSYPYANGLYRNGKKLVVAKIWQGKRKDVHYYALCHEMVVYKVLARVLKRIGADNLSVCFPVFIDSIQLEDSLILIRSYVTGRPLSHLRSTDKQLNYYNDCVHSLRLIGSKLTLEEKRLISHKSGRSFIALFPLLWFVCIVKHPSEIGTLVKAAIVFFWSSASFSHDSYTLVHGDLHPDNIIVDRNSLSIVDVEQMMVTFPAYECIATISSTKSTEKFRESLTQMLIDEEKSRHQTLQLAALIVNCSIHNLTGNSRRASVERYFSMLHFGITIAKENSQLYRFRLGVS